MCEGMGRAVMCYPCVRKDRWRGLSTGREEAVVALVLQASGLEAWSDNAERRQDGRGVLMRSRCRFGSEQAQ